MSDASREGSPLRPLTSTFYEGLRWRAVEALERALGRLGGRVAAYALVVPDLLQLYRGALADDRVPKLLRGELIALGIYLVSPVDLVPEALLGPLGLVDDALVATRLLDALLNRIPDEVVRAHWPGDGAVLARAQRFARGARQTFSLGLGFGVASLARRAVSALVHAAAGERGTATLPWRAAPSGGAPLSDRDPR